MARLPRLDLPHIPQHVVQRGNNRLPCFLDDLDRRCYLTVLREALLDAECALHAYVLMDNHTQLLVIPPHTGAISRMMQKLGREYSGLFNARHRRTGTLWEGRYKSCLVDSEVCVLHCYRYIDLNPVRARMIEDPAMFPWSSCLAHCGIEDALLTAHAAYVALGTNLAERGVAYQVLLDESLSEDTIQEVRAFLNQQRAMGRDDFRAMVEAKTRRFAGIRPAQRPRKLRAAGSDGGDSQESNALK
jgi:putative transposase